MDMWIIIHNLLFVNRLPVPITQESREAKASEVGRAAAVLVDKWREWGGVESVKYYLHTLVMHIPDQIRRCPVEWTDVSGAAVEMLNKFMKKLMK